MGDLNKGFNLVEYNEFKEKATENVREADRDKTAVAEWVQGEEANVSIEGKKVNIGNDDGINMMEMVLASLAACDVAVVALHASFLGVKLNSLRAEMSGHYNVAAMLGVEGSSSAGYDRISAKIYLDAPEATEDQLHALKHACEFGSPVGHTFAHNVPTDIEIIRT